VFCLGIALSCSSKYQRAEGLAKGGQFVEAAELFEQLLRADPKNKDLLERRERARWRALEQLLGQARTARRKDDHARADAQFERFLTYRRRWNTHLDGAMQSSQDDELEAIRKHLRQTVAAPAKAGLVLGAEKAYAGKGALFKHPELSAIRDEMAGELGQGAAAVCQRLQTEDASGSHWAELVWKYCDHFGIRIDGPKAPDVTANSLVLELLISGAGSGQQAATERMVLQAFSLSPWFSSRSENRVPAKITGEWNGRQSRQPVSLSANWIEQVPYQATEVVKEPYQESVTVMETVTENEPYTENETYTYPCGTTTCTGTRPVTRYRSVQVQKPVTKEQTRYRDVTREVTRYRDVPRVFNYDAVEVTANYRVGLAFKSEIEPKKAPLVASLTERFSQSDYEHDVHFPAARVLPRKSKLPTGEGWFQTQLVTFGSEVRRQLFARWKESFCSAGAFNVDEASRCARAGAALPAPAIAALTPVFGEDAARVSALFASEEAP
jgi:hypothetical protein